MSLDAETYFQLIQNPNVLETNQVFELENIIQAYPYFQSAKALHLKSLYHQNSPRYNHWLKQTAAYTTDRSVLFEFIISNEFKTLPIPKENNLTEIVALEEEFIEIKEENNLEIEAKETTKEVEISIEKNEIEQETLLIEEKLSIGKPFVFELNEEHSFEEWLQLTKVKPINRSEKKDWKEEIKIEEKKQENEATLDQEESNTSSFEGKISIIEKFINENPKIKPVKDLPISVNVKTSLQDTNSLMTETLARIYLEQKKYQKAIQAYQILILKYPEKSYLFADRIEDIKILQQNHT